MRLRAKIAMIGRGMLPIHSFVEPKKRRMAESVVSFALEKLGALLRDEVQLLWGMRTEVEYIKDELERMRAFLEVSDAAEESDESIRVWVKQVRDVAYDIEDVIDEFMVRLVHHHGHGIFASFRKISCSIVNFTAHCWVASEIQSIKCRVRDISEGQKRYSNHRNAVLKQGSSLTAGNNSWCDRRGDALLLEEAELVGINNRKRELIEWLLKEGDSGLKAVSVVGMGGLGKTTLVKKVYDDPGLKMRFQSHAWITVSQSFKMEELLRDMIRQLFHVIKEPIPPGVETMNSQGLKKVINEFLQDKRYLLVLDDVWNTNDWGAFRNAFPNKHCGSRVMLTTRIGEVASASSKECHGNVYELKPLSLEESWTLFCRKTFNDDECPPHLEELSRSILKRCEGLPLAIVAISGVLATKDNHRIDEWEMVHRSLGAELESDDRFKCMKTILSLSYHNLPRYLKYCFLYLSIFPEGHLIERMRLIRLWIAEGFVEEKEGRTLEEVAEGYINQLINRSLIQVARITPYDKVHLLRIHDLLRETILSKSKDQYFVAIAGEGNRRWPERVRRLSVHNSWENVQENSNISQLRSVLMFGVVDLLSNSSKLSLFCGGLRLLKVLDLRGLPLEIFPEGIVQQFNLRYLSLRRTKIRTLPTSIGQLQNLETLDLKHTFVTELPVEILKLHRLRHLLAYHYNNSLEPYQAFHHLQGFRALEGIGGLPSLQKLNYLEASEASGHLMREIGKLSQLRRLGVLKLRRQDGKVLFSSIKRLSNLRSLYVTSIREDEMIDLPYPYSPPKFLQRLFLRGRLESLPQWISSLHGLIRLFLKWSRLREDPLETLKGLPSLVQLELLQVYEGRTLCFKNGGFQKLKFLNLEKMDRLERVTVEKGAMPDLETLIIQRCNGLKKMPTGIEHLSKLKLLEFFDMPDDLITTIQPDKQGDYAKVAHIPEVYSTYWRDGGWDACSLDRLSKRQRREGPSTAIRGSSFRNWHKHGTT